MKTILKINLSKGILEVKGSETFVTKHYEDFRKNILPYHFNERYNNKKESQKLLIQFDKIDSNFNPEFIAKCKKTIAESHKLLHNEGLSLNYAARLFSGWYPLNWKKIKLKERADYMSIHELMLMNYLNNCSSFSDIEIENSIYKTNRLTGRNHSYSDVYNKEMTPYFSNNFSLFLEKYAAYSENINEQVSLLKGDLLKHSSVPR